MDDESLLFELFQWLVSNTQISTVLRRKLDERDIEDVATADMRDLYDILLEVIEELR